MQPEAYYELAARQATYWWHRARRATVTEMLRRLDFAPGSRWLDVGCGPGGNLDMLEAFRPALVVGADISTAALTLARRAVPDAALVQADLSKGLPFAGVRFDLVTILHMLYHRWVPQEIEVVAEAARVLKPGGLLVVTEPAFRCLSREMDIAVMAKRRYRREEIAGLCRHCGLEILFVSYFTSVGFPLFFVANAVKRIIGRPPAGDNRRGIDMKPMAGPINEILFRAASIEGLAISRGVKIPFGTSVICLARKPRRAVH